MNTWKPVLSELRREIQTVTNGRTYRVKKYHPKHAKLWDIYLSILRALLPELKLYAAITDPEGYADHKGVELSTPPRWTDFVPDADKKAMIQRQGAFIQKGVRYKEMFCSTPTPLRGTVRYNNLLASIREDTALNTHQYEQCKASNLDTEFCERRQAQLDLAMERLLSFTPITLKVAWWPALLHPDERETGIALNDEAKLVDYTPPRLEPGAVAPKNLGRPRGVKDKNPRTRKTLTPEERMRRKEKLVKNRAYKLALAKRMVASTTSRGEQS